MNIRTDLALERHEMHPSESPGSVEIREYKNSDCKATVIDISDEKGSKSLGKPIGKYITIEADTFPDSASVSDGRLEMLSEMLKKLIPEKGTVLIAGLGNTDITPDAIGPLCAEKILATRHIDEDTKNKLMLPRLREVAVISPGVTGKTGIETVEIIAGIKEKIKPSVIIVIDALAARSIKRLGKTIQLCNTGIEPGSGVMNRRRAINEETMGIPVIAAGIPTVVDAATLCYDLTGQSVKEDEYSSMMVTPKNTDALISSGATLLALAINSVLQPSLTQEEIISLTMP